MTGPRRPLLLGVGAGALYATFLIDWVRRGVTSLDHVVSELAAPGEPQAWVYRAGEVGCAVLLLRTLPAARGAMTPSTGREVMAGATVVFAVGACVAGLVPTPSGPQALRGWTDRRPRSAVHDRASIVSTGSLYTAMTAAWVATRHSRPRWFSTVTGVLLGIGTASSLAFGLTRSSARWRRVAGVSQRLDILAASAWFVALGALGAHGAHSARSAHTDATEVEGRRG